MVRENTVKKRLANGENVIGTFVKSTDPTMVELLSLCGFDFIIIDNEHTIMNQETLTNLIRAADAGGLVPTVRVREINDSLIRQVLDTGALGVQVPLVNTGEDARSVVSSVKYAPIGTRGYAASQRSAAYGFMNAKEYADISNECTLVVCYCETLESINNLDEILKVDNVDVIFIGPYDLSQALGVLGEPNHPKVLAAIDEIIAKVRAAGKAVGTIASNAEAANRLMQKGVQYICLSSDTGMMAEMAKSMLAGLKK